VCSEVMGAAAAAPAGEALLDDWGRLGPNTLPRLRPRAVRDAVVELLEEAFKVDPGAVMAHLSNQHIRPAKRAAICAALGVEEPGAGGGTPGVSYSISRATTRDEVRVRCEAGSPAPRLLARARVAGAAAPSSGPNQPLALPPLFSAPGGVPRRGGAVSSACWAVTLPCCPRRAGRRRGQQLQRAEGAELRQPQPQAALAQGPGHRWARPWGLGTACACPCVSRQRIPSPSVLCPLFPLCLTPPHPPHPGRGLHRQRAPPGGHQQAQHGRGHGANGAPRRLWRRWRPDCRWRAAHNAA
jgi:hypothetical protein